MKLWGSPSSSKPASPVAAMAEEEGSSSSSSSDSVARPMDSSSATAADAALNNGENGHHDASGGSSSNNNNSSDGEGGHRPSSLIDTGDGSTSSSDNNATKTNNHTDELPIDEHPPLGSAADFCARNGLIDGGPATSFDGDYGETCTSSMGGYEDDDEEEGGGSSCGAATVGGGGSGGDGPPLLFPPYHFGGGEVSGGSSSAPAIPFATANSGAASAASTNAPIFKFTSNTTTGSSTSGTNRTTTTDGASQTAAAALSFGANFTGNSSTNTNSGSAVVDPSEGNNNNNNSLINPQLGDILTIPTGVPINSIIGNTSTSTEGKSDSPQWQPQSITSTCEFTHIIESYSSKRDSGCKKAEYSSTTTDSLGNKWRLIIYVNGNGRASNHHLSLFLQVADAEDLPFGWNKAVSYVLTLEHPQGAQLGYAKRNPDKTFKMCPKAIDWGWSQFITSDRIQQEGYINNDTLVVRASVTVKSSSVNIDPEDAELYLKCAVEEGDAAAVNTCLAQDASVNCQFKDDMYTPLHTACSASGNEGGSSNNGGSANGSANSNNGGPVTPGPVSPGNLEVLNLLLEKGADVNACNKWRETPLLIAANNGHVEAVKALLATGADPSLCSEAGWSALTFAAHKGYEEIVGLLLAADAPVNCRVTEDLSTPLHKACAGNKPGHLSAVTQLLEMDADVHALNKWRETPLLTAANHGQTEAVEALLQYDADPCKCTDTGWSPLSIAAYKGHDDVVRLLLEEGAPTEEDDPTLSALLQAATKGLPDTCMLLLRHGADHTVTTKKGDTALAILVEQNLIDAAVEMVTDYNASVPRCSRDRKKVQRARLLINLRLKQMQREGTGPYCDDSDEGESDADPENGTTGALHDESGRAASPLTSGGSKKKKGKKSGQKSAARAEADARAAEEALLLELEEEEKVKTAASEAKSSKKKKKKKDKVERVSKEAEKVEDDAKVSESKAKSKESHPQPQNASSPAKKEKVIEITSDTVSKPVPKPTVIAKEEPVKPKPKQQQKKETSQQPAKNKEVSLPSAPLNNKKSKEVSLSSQSEGKKHVEPKSKSSSESGAKKARGVSLPKTDATKKNAAAASKKIPGDNPAPRKIPGNNPAPKRIPGDNPVPKRIPGDNPKVPGQQSQQNVQSLASSPAKSKRGWESKGGKPSDPATSQPRAQSKSQKVDVEPGKETKKSTQTATSAKTDSKPKAKSPLGTSDTAFSPSGKSKPRSDESTNSTSNSTADSLPATPTAQKTPSSNAQNKANRATVDDELATMANDVLGFLDFYGQPSSQSTATSSGFEGLPGYPSAQRLAMTPPPVNLQPPPAIVSSPAASSSYKPPMSIELPSVSLFRLEKLQELFRRYSVARSSSTNPLRVIDEHTLRVVLYRWIIRASHGSEAFLDPVIPSWEDNDYLKAFLQRQFISESRRSMEDSRYNSNVPSIEVLRNAGAAMSELCLSLAKEVSQFRLQCEQQVPPNWSDADINVAGMENNGNVIIDWSGKSRMSIPFNLFTSMARRYVGEQNRLMAAVFSAVRRHEVIGAIAGETNMIFELPPQTVDCLTKGLGANLETWSDSVLAYANNSFCAMFPDVDAAFGGLPPFGKEKGGGESVLNRAGGSVIVLTPPENATASQCMRKVIDMAEGSGNIPLSFSVILSSDCFVNASNTLTADDLRTLDPRLCGEQNSFISFVEVIPAGVSNFSKSSSMFILIQNEAGKRHFPPHHSVIDNVRCSMRSDMVVREEIPASPSFSGLQNEPRYDAPSFQPVQQQQHQYQENPFASDISFAMGGGAAAVGGNRGGGRGHRGRLFELVGEGEAEEDQGMSILPGMLDSLNVNMFGGSSTSDEVDIEAISLMGIGLNGGMNRYNQS